MNVVFDNVSGNTTTAWGNKLHTRVVNETMTFANRHVMARGANLLLAPASVIPCVIDIMAGLAAGAISLATLGFGKRTVNFAARELRAANNLISKPYEFLLRTINPKASFGRLVHPHGADINAAIVAIPLAGTVGGKAHDLALSENIFVRHVVARGAYLATGVAAVISRVALAALAVPAVALSVATLGCVKPFNTFASKSLQLPGLVSDLFMCTVKFINPWAGDEKRQSLPPVHEDADEQSIADVHGEDYSDAGSAADPDDAGSVADPVDGSEEEGGDPFEDAASAVPAHGAVPSTNVSRFAGGWEDGAVRETAPGTEE